MKKTDILIEKYITPILKKYKFKKKKYTWNRNRKYFTDIINIQKLPGSTDKNEKFVINIGIAIPEYNETIWGKPSSSFIMEEDAILRYRLNDLLKKKEYTIIELNTDKDIIEIGQILQNIIETSVLSHFNSIEDIKSIGNILEDDDRWINKYPLNQLYFALLQNSLGNKKSAIAILDNIYSDSSDSWKIHAKQLKDKIS